MRERILKIGTRGSALALVQARQVQGLLPGPSEIVVIRTSGDRFQDVSLQDQGGVGFFTREIEEALAAWSIDLAVHSLKDLPVTLPPDMVLGAVLPRVDPGDVLLVHPDAVDPERSLPVREGLRVGTSAHRRRAFLGRYRPDLEPVAMRGNVPTRVTKALRGDCEALVLARAGVSRLRQDIAPLVPFDLNPTRWVCAAGQAAVVVECRATDQEVRERLAPLHHEPTARCIDAERRLLQASGGGCHSAFSAWASLDGDGALLHLAMPGPEGAFHLGRVRAPTLEEAVRQAESWVRAGGTPPWSRQEEEGEWLCRPARPWC